MTEDEVRKRLRYAIADRGGKQVTLARELGVSPQFVNQVLKGNKSPSASMLRLVGLERVESVVYRKLRAPDAAEA